MKSLFLVFGLFSVSMAVGQIPPTPNDDDIPKPVPIEVDLADSDRPDFSRFANVRAAFSPSFSRDGSLEPLAVSDLDDLATATPAIAGDTIYARTQSALWAFRSEQ